MIIFVIVAISAISLVLSYVSIRNDLKKSKHVEEVKKDLAKGRVIYYRNA